MLLSCFIENLGVYSSNIDNLAYPLRFFTYPRLGTVELDSFFNQIHLFIAFWNSGIFSIIVIRVLHISLSKLCSVSVHSCMPLSVCLGAKSRPMK